MHIFTGKVEDDTTIIFNKNYIIVGKNKSGIIFHLYWLILHTRMFIFRIKKGGNSRDSVIDHETINSHKLCYKCFKYGSYFFRYI